MERLKPLRKHLVSVSFILLLIVIVISVGVGLAVNYFSSSLNGVIAGIACLIIGGLFISTLIAKESLKSTEFLSRAILHVAHEQSTVGAPKLESVPAAREFFERLARQIYDLASQALPNSDGKSMSNDMAGNFQKSLLHNSPLPIYVLDAQNNLTYANQAGEEYAKFKLTEVSGKPFYDVLKLSFASDKTLEEWLNESRQQRLTGSHYWDRVRLQLDDDSVKQCDMAVRFNKDNPEGVESVIVLFDHTNRYSQDDRGASFVAMAVHELRTPLTIMRGYIEVFEDEISDKLDNEQAEFMRTMSAQAQQLSSLVNNIMNFTRIEENQFIVSMKEADWSSIVENSVKDLELRARVRHKVIKTEIAENLPHVAVDQATINEVIVNLVENAIKYTHNDDPIIVKTYQKNDNFIETVVEDKGIGIPTALMGHIFDKFYRSHRSNRSVGGTGLGLYLCKAIVTAHGGEIWVKSKEGQGSSFGFTVPTYSSVASKVQSSDNGTIERGAHGWIKNHSLYRG